MNQWLLVDGRSSLEEGEDHPHTIITSEKQLRGELNQQAAKKPGAVSLISPDEESLDVGIGGPYAAIAWYPSPNQRGYKIALADRLYSETPVDFVSEGVAAPADPAELFPVQAAIEAAIYFYRNRRLPDWFAWRAWNPVTLTWDSHPATGACRVPAASQ